jgi:hypothetical protein
LHDKHEEALADDRPFFCPFGEGGAVYHPTSDRLMILNPTGKMVWEMLSAGYERDIIASAFARHFSISEERARHDVGRVLGHLGESGSPSEENAGDAAALAGAVAFFPAPVASPEQLGDCGTFRFADRRIRIVSSVADLDGLFFVRFRHRAVDAEDADVLEVSRSGSRFLLTLRGRLVAEATTSSKMTSFVNELLLSLEHPHRRLLAFCHAGAVCWNGRSLLLPGRSGAGKSTLTAFLVGNGFSYLGDDTIAIGEDEAALLPLPTCLSIKSGSWPLLEPLYPILRQSPIINRYARSLRYVDAENTYPTLQAAAAPLAIVFPAYAAGEPTQLAPVSPLQTMITLLGAHARLSTPATEAKLAKLIRFVEQTPAYELTYSQLPEAQQAIMDLLASP